LYHNLHEEDAEHLGTVTTRGGAYYEAQLQRVEAITLRAGCQPRDLHVIGSVEGWVRLD